MLSRVLNAVELGFRLGVARAPERRPCEAEIVFQLGKAVGWNRRVRGPPAPVVDDDVVAVGRFRWGRRRGG